MGYRVPLLPFDCPLLSFDGVLLSFGCHLLSFPFLATISNTFLHFAPCDRVLLHLALPCVSLRHQTYVLTTLRTGSVTKAMNGQAS